MAVAVVAVLVVVLGAAGLGGGRRDVARNASPTYATATVEARTLHLTTTLDGRLDRGRAASLPIRATGTVTWLPPAGSVRGRGAIALRVDDRPVVLMIGAMPSYRSLADAAGQGTMRGQDVRQLQSNLNALGYDVHVDGTFTSATAAAVRDWQRDLGVEPTGKVALGDVVFVGGPVRLEPRPETLGRAVGEDTLTFTGIRKQVTVTAPADDLGWARPGARVKVGLPDGRSVRGRVHSVGRVASAGESAESGQVDEQAPTVPVLISVADQRSLRKFDGGPVTVEYISGQRKNVLAVPVSALIALAEGGYGVEPEGTPGQFVAVTPGMFAQGMVEITGDVQPGTKVRTPA